jgi:putative transposase
VAAMMADAKTDVLAFTAFPKAHWQKIWSNNPIVICSAAVSVFQVDHEVSEGSVLRSGCGYLQPSMKQSLEGRCACCEGGFTALVA